MLEVSYQKCRGGVKLCTPSDRLPSGIKATGEFRNMNISRRKYREQKKKNRKQMKQSDKSNRKQLGLESARGQMVIVLNIVRLIKMITAKRLK